MNCRLVTGISLVACAFACTNALEAQVIINELMADNTSTDYDDFFESEDWVELYNLGGIVNLAGYYLTDDPDSLNKWMFPSTNPGLTTILPGGHLRIWCDKDPEQGEDHADFKLSIDGEFVLLVEPDGATVVDQIAFSAQQSNISYGRSCDGCPDWIFFDLPTPEAPNAYVQPATEQLYFNEFQHLNASTIAPEVGPVGAWLELYNPNPIAVNAAGYVISSEAGEWTVPANDPVHTVIPAEGFLLIWLHGATEWGSNCASIAVGTVPPTAWTLTGPNGMVLDEVTWTPAVTDESWGRSTDGGPIWQFFPQPTPQVSNQTLLFAGAPLVINELLSHNVWGISDEAGEREDWFEVHNPTSSPVDLAGYYLTDQWNNPTKFRIPVGVPDSTVIPPGGFKLFWADEDQTQGWNHVNFRLSNVGEHLALRSPDGFSVVDSLNFPTIWPNFSFGRLTDAGEPWVFFEQTTPEASNNGATVEVEASVPQRFRVHPNPVASTDHLVVPAAGTLWTIDGRQVQSWAVPTTLVLAGGPGMYVIHWATAAPTEPTKVLVH